MFRYTLSTAFSHSFNSDLLKEGEISKLKSSGEVVAGVGEREGKRKERIGRVKRTKIELNQQQNICYDGSSRKKKSLREIFMPVPPVICCIMLESH